MVAASELDIDEGASALEMAEAIFGTGVTVISARYSGDDRSSGLYTGGEATSPGVVPGDSGVILSTGRVRDFTNSSGEANQAGNTSTNTTGVNRDDDFDDAAGARTYDASFLEISFIPDNPVLTIQLVYGSEEYPEYQDSAFQDLVGVWVNGAQATLSTGDGNVDPGNVNAGMNENLYVDNTASQFNTEMDGFTTTLTLKMDVTPGVVNTLKIGVADVGDAAYDSSLLIAAGSAQTALIAEDDEVVIQPDGSKVIDVLANDVSESGATLTVTHVNGIAVAPGDTVTLPSGQTVALNADGTLTLAGDGDTEEFSFTYTTTDGTTSDVGLVGVTSVPCFTAGTLILTAGGEVPVELLVPGDLVMTCDDGPQPLRWVGRRTVPATGDLAPVRIHAGTFGDHGDLLVSPQHRVLIRDARAELLFGDTEVLIAAKDLVDGARVTREPGGVVTYVHLMFDRHQVIWSQGLATESFLPGPMMRRGLDAPVLEEIRAIFPEIDPATGAGYGPAVRRLLKCREARMLTLAARAA